MAKPLQRRGQFYVRAVDGTSATIPIDNFLFITGDNKEEVKLESTSDSVYVSWRMAGFAESRIEAFRTKAFALRRLANILEGKVTFEEFATQPSQRPVVVKV